MQQTASAKRSSSFGIDWKYLSAEWKTMFQPSTLTSDIASGITVALVALPLNLALAIAAGVEPGVGITTGIISAIIAAFFGGQRLAITGPAAAMAVVLVEIAHHHGIEGIWFCCLMAGVLQIVAGCFRLGKLISFIPMPVMVGFANGIGVLVLANAIDDFMGLTGKPIAHAHVVQQMAKVGVPEFFLDVSDVFIRGFVGHELKPQALGIGVLSLALALITTRLTKKVPGALVAIVGATIASSLMGLSIPTIATISHIPNMLPAPSLPDIPWQDIMVLFPSAITIFLLGSIESLLSATVADGMSMSTKHHSNQELIGQGLANCVVPFFGGIPVTGVIARTAVNIRAGAKTRLSAIIHSATLAVLIFFLAKYAEQIPLSALASILILTGFRLIEWDSIQEIWKASKLEAYASFATTAAAVCVDLTFGVFVGLMIACGLFIRQMSKVQLVDLNEDSVEIPIAKVPACKFVKTYVIDGPLFFGAAERFIDNIVVVDTVKAIILHMGAAKVMDLTGVETLLSIHRQLSRHGGWLVLSDLPPQPLQLLERTHAIETIGRENIYRDYKTAVLSVNRALLNSSCSGCRPQPAIPGEPKSASSTGVFSKLTGAFNKQTGSTQKKTTGAVAKLTGSLSKATGEVGMKAGGHSDCPLHLALLDPSNPMRNQLAELEMQLHGAAGRNDPSFDWLVPVKDTQSIPRMLENTPIGTLIRAQNFGQVDDNPNQTPQLVVGMCIDYRKQLTMPNDYAYTIRREGANMSGAEFAIALALSKGINHMALIAHNNCAMSNTKEAKEQFVNTLIQKYNWPSDKANDFFDEQARSKDIGNEIDFVMGETKRLTTLFPGLTIVPLLFRVENDKLFFILDWLMEHAPSDFLTKSHNDRLVGKASVMMPKFTMNEADA